MPEPGRGWQGCLYEDETVDVQLFLVFFSLLLFLSAKRVSLIWLGSGSGSGSRVWPANNSVLLAWLAGCDVAPARTHEKRGGGQRNPQRIPKCMPP